MKDFFKKWIPRPVWNILIGANILVIIFAIIIEDWNLGLLAIFSAINCYISEKFLDYDEGEK